MAWPRGVVQHTLVVLIVLAATAPGAAPATTRVAQECGVVGCTACSARGRCTRCDVGYQLKAVPRAGPRCWCAPGAGSWGAAPLPTSMVTCGWGDAAQDVANGCVCSACPAGMTSNGGRIDLATCLPSTPQLPRRALSSGPLFVGYYESWSQDWGNPPTRGADTDLASIPAYVNVVILSFAKPDCKYTKGSLDLSKTGLLFAASGPVMRDAVALLRARQPSTAVLLSVGGSGYKKWSKLNVQCVKDLVDDLGLDGADIDYEPVRCGCTMTGPVACKTDPEIVGVTSSLRAAMPKGSYILSTATSGAGAYGEAFPDNSQWDDCRGINLAQAKSAAGKQLDLINIMAYCLGSNKTDQDTGFQPTQSLLAHVAAFPASRVALGVMVWETDCWGSGFTTEPMMRQYAAFTLANGGAGMMMWSLMLSGPTTPAWTGPGPKPTSAALAHAACEVLGLPDCATPLNTCQGAC